MRRLVPLVVAAALCAGGARAETRAQRVLVAGPALSAGVVAWTESDGTAARLLIGGPGRPPVTAADQRGAWRFPRIAGSSSALVFERNRLDCPTAGGVCTGYADVAAGSPPGPFGVVVVRSSCSQAGVGGPGYGDDVDASRGEVAVSEIECDAYPNYRRRIRVGRIAGPLRAVVDMPSRRCCDRLRLAGRYAAWPDGDAVVVRDLRTNRNAYVARLYDRRFFGIVDLALQPDGTLAVAYEPRPARPAKLVWFSRAQPVQHVLGLRPHVADLRRSVALAGGRIFVERPGALVLVDLKGRERVVAQLGPSVLRVGDLALSTTRAAWATARIVSRRWDCPPPGMGRPCFEVATGATTVWELRLSARAPRRVAVLPFVDLPVASLAR